MDVWFSPLATAVLNIIASFLVAKGILDQGTKEMFVQTMNNMLAAFVTVGIGGYSIYKMVDLHKHKLTLTMTPQGNGASTTTLKVTSTEASTDPAKFVVAGTQTGLPNTQL